MILVEDISYTKLDNILVMKRNDPPDASIAATTIPKRSLDSLAVRLRRSALNADTEVDMVGAEYSVDCLLV